MWNSFVLSMGIYYFSVIFDVLKFIVGVEFEVEDDEFVESIELGIVYFWEGLD